MTITHGAELAIIPVVATSTLVALAFTPAEITALTIAAATLLGAIFSGVALIITTLRSTQRRVDETAIKVADNTALTERINAKVDTVGIKVDGTASKAQEQIASLHKEIAWMRERLSEQKQDAAMLAQAKASAPAITSIAEASGGQVAEKSLDNIDENTAEIKTNTAKTEQKVDQLKDKL